MKLTLTMHDKTVSITIANGDVTLPEMLSEYKGLLLAAGYVFDGNIELIDEVDHNTEGDNDETIED